MTRRWILAMLIAVIGTFSVTGCSVALTGMMGISAADDHVIAEIVMCNENTANGIDMLPQQGQFFLLPHPSWRFDSEHLPKFDLGSTADFLELVGDGVKRLDVSTNNGGVMTPHFEQSTIESLAEGEILVRSEDSRTSATVSRSEFDQLTTAFCAENEF